MLRKNRTPNARRGCSTAGRRAATAASASELSKTVSHADAFAISRSTARAAARSDAVAPLPLVARRY